MSMSAAGGGSGEDSSATIKNFRPVAGTRNLYRCAHPDGLADLLLDGAGAGAGVSGAALHPDEDLVLNRAGLVIDLRSESERDADRCRAWLDRGAFRVVERSGDVAAAAEPPAGGASSPRPPRRFRRVLRLDPLSLDRLMPYLERNWMTPRERRMALWYKLVDGQALHDLRLDVLNRNGLAGLNRAVLATGGPCLADGLRAIVLHLEGSGGGGDGGTAASSSSSPPAPAPVVVHCVQGKDRTGMLSMLCQLVVGLDEAEIVEDYHRSEARLAPGAAAVARAYPGKIDRRFFTGAPRAAMVETLQWIRDRYGGVDGYLDAMGLGADWRDRLVSVLKPAQRGAVENGAAVAEESAVRSLTVSKL
jgi:hypothetical protein